MIRLVTLCLVAACACAARVQPQHQSGYCTEDGLCDVGYYCALAKFSCEPCMSCDDFKRQPPVNDSCVTSFTDCGNCLKGLVPGVAGDICTEPPDARAAPLPWYMWLLIALALLFVAVGIGACQLLKKRQRTSQTVNLTVPSTESAKVNGVPASAPPAHTPPPPYWPSPQPYARSPEPYFAPSSPPAPTELATPLAENPAFGYPLHTYTEESEQPLVSKQPGALRERSQAAAPFNPPAYVRHSQIRDGEDHGEAESEIDTEGGEDGARGEGLPFDAHDDETMMSDWTPDASGRSGEGDSERSLQPLAAGGASAGAPSVGSRPFAALRRPDRSDLSPPPPKLSRGDSNNNRNHEAGEGSSSATFGAPRGGTNFFINIVNEFVNNNNLK